MLQLPRQRVILDNALLGLVLGFPDLLHLGRREVIGLAVACLPESLAPVRLRDGPGGSALRGHVPPFAEDRIVDRDIAEVLRPLRAQTSTPIAQVLDEDRFVLLDELPDILCDEARGPGDQVSVFEGKRDVSLLQDADRLLCREGGQG